MKIRVFLDVIQELRKENAKLQEENKRLREENRQLKARIAELEEKLKTNSNNSSKPPSQDPYRSKKPKSPSDKKAGGQPGHKGTYRQLAPKSQVTDFIEVLPKNCSKCGNVFSAKNICHTKVKQQIEIPPIQPQITQYNIHHCYCTKCNHVEKGESPVEVRDSSFGPRLSGLITLARAHLKLAKREIIDLIGYFNIAISVGSICNIHKEAGKILKVPFEEIRKKVLSHSYVHADETTWLQKGRRHYVWVGTTKEATFFQIEPSRSQKACQMIFKGFTQTLITDRYSGYNLHGINRQFCHAHLKRNFEKIVQRKGVDAVLGKKLLELEKVLFEMWHAFKNKEISRKVFQSLFKDRVRIPFLAYLAEGMFDESYNKKTRKTCKSLFMNSPMLWTFTEKEGVEPTNNLAERDLRQLVLLRKKTYGNQSKHGLEFTARIFTVYQTLKKQSMPLWDYFTSIFTSKRHNLPIQPIFRTS